MKRLGKAVRYSAVGVTIAGIISTLAGCSAEDSIRALLLFLIMLLMGGGGESATEVPPVTAVVMFSAGTFNGDLQTAGGGATGREGADNLCRAAKPAAVTNPNVRAFISVSATDEIRDMPTNYGVPTLLPITGPTGTVIVGTWQGLLDAPNTNLLTRPDVAGVGNPGGDSWWSGTEIVALTAVHDSSNDCTGWTNGAAGNGRRGFADGVSSDFYDFGTQSCSGSHALFCIAF